MSQYMRLPQCIEPIHETYTEYMSQFMRLTRNIYASIGDLQRKYEPE